MLHSEISLRPTPSFERDPPIFDKQERLALFCKEWHIPAPTYRYIRNRYSGEGATGIHSTVVVNEIEYSSTLASSGVHPGWYSKNDAREAVAGEVLRVLGLEAEDDGSLPLILEEP